MALIFMAAAVAYELGRGYTESALSSEFPPPPVIRPLEASGLESVQPIPDSQVVESSSPTGPVIALIIDDAGIDPRLTQAVFELGIPLTVAFLPYAEATPALARRAHSEGHDIFLHLPMEPIGFADPGPEALTRHLSEAEIMARAYRAWQAVPNAIGFNNHMGSAFTANTVAMDAVLSALGGFDPIVVDSLTSGRSRVAQLADGHGLVSLRRDVFIDHDPDGISAALDQMAEIARERGQVLAIGHPRSNTIGALQQWLANPENQDIQFVTIRDYIALTSPQAIQASNETVSLLGGAE